MDHVTHAIAPVFDRRSRALVLGTMPSPASRAAGFFYMHPRNRFWPVMAAVFGAETPEGVEARRAFALEHRFALWDTIASCDIAGASDSSIANVVPNDIAALVAGTEIRAVFTTGATATRLYRRYQEQAVGLPLHPLPSSSPANCAVSREALIEAYRAVRTAIESAK